MSEKWTPGPWVADSTHVRTAVNSVATANTQRKHVAMVNIAKNQDYEITIEEHVANARLIAAAPELYEALEAMLEFPNCGPSHSFAKTALKKARGE